jgi:hypothetical protein
MNAAVQLASLDYAKPLQEPDELAQLAKLLADERVLSYAEIGARYGGSFETIMRALPVGAFGMTVDWPGAPFGDSNSAPILLSAAARLRREGYAVDCLFGDARGDVYQQFTRRAPVDALMIDADHSYFAVKRDFEVYAPLARIVILHDIAAPEHVRSHDGRPVEVPRFWNEIKGKYRHLEIIAPDSLMGIGVIWR